MALPSPMGLCRAQTSGGRLCERFFLTKAMLESLEKGVRRTKGVKNKQKKDRSDVRSTKKFDFCLKKEFLLSR